MLLMQNSWYRTSSHHFLRRLHQRFMGKMPHILWNNILRSPVASTQHYVNFKYQHEQSPNIKNFYCIHTHARARWWFSWFDSAKDVVPTAIENWWSLTCNLEYFLRSSDWTARTFTGSTLLSSSWIRSSQPFRLSIVWWKSGHWTSATCSSLCHTSDRAWTLSKRCIIERTLELSDGSEEPAAARLMFKTVPWRDSICTCSSFNRSNRIDIFR